MKISHFYYAQDINALRAMVGLIQHVDADGQLRPIHRDRWLGLRPGIITHLSAALRVSPDLMDTPTRSLMLALFDVMCDIESEDGFLGDNLDEWKKIRAGVNDLVSRSDHHDIGVQANIAEHEHTKGEVPRVLVFIDEQGVASYSADDGVEVVVFDVKNKEAVPSNFADLAQAFDDVPVISPAPMVQ